MFDVAPAHPANGAAVVTTTPELIDAYEKADAKHVEAKAFVKKLQDRVDDAQQQLIAAKQAEDAAKEVLKQAALALKQAL